MLSKYVQCLLVDREKKLWIGSFGRYAKTAPPGMSLTIVTPRERQLVSYEDSGGGSVSALFQDSQGRIWIGGNRTVSVFNGAHFRPFPPTNGVPLAGVRCFAEDRLDGAIWAASSDGLLRFVEGHWQEIKGFNGKSLINVICLRAEQDGSLWLGGAGVGLLRLKQGQWSSITEAHGLPTHNISCILDDDLGYWWLGTNRGVLRASNTDIARVAGGLLSSLPYRLFNLSDGMGSMECTMGFQNTGLKDSLGRLWFATVKGVAMVDPRKLALNAIAPPVTLENIGYVDREGCQQGLTPSYLLSGRGMDGETYAHLFEPFFTTKELGKGTGLGLATVFGIVKQNHGFINVYSEPGQGATFKIYLPRAYEEVEEIQLPKEAEPIWGTETVLLVEDEEQILQLARRILEQNGYTVLAALAPQQAIELASRHTGRIHLLITDVVMPGMNGKDLRVQIEAVQPGLRCLFISGYPANVIVHYGVLAKEVHFLPKPFTIQTFSEKVREVLDS